MDDWVAKGTISNISRTLSLYISNFCWFHQELSPAVFNQLTDEKYLPNNGISAQAAVRLLDAERKISGEDRSLKNEIGKLSNLQIRCVNAIVCGKQGAFLKEDSKFQDFSPLVLREIIIRSFYGIPENPQ
jgi:hypothetical protein